MSASPAAQRRFTSEENGAIFAEYAMLVALIAVVCVLTVMGVGQTAQGIWVSSCNAVTTAIAGAPAC
jgi:Flp pilus assembly pilin Flp